MKTQPLVAAEQAHVPFHGSEIMAVRLPDGLIAAVLATLCDMLKIATNAQARRIRRDEALSEHLLQVIIETPGGPQLVDVLTAWAIPTWLTGLNLNMIALEKRPMILALKREAADVLYRYFFKLDASETVQPAPAQAQQLPRSALEMHIEAWQETEREWDAREERYETRLAVVEQQLARVMAQVASLEQRDGGARGEEPPPQAGRILSQTHIGQVYALAQHHRRQSGEPISDMLRDLAETFGVPDMSDIPDEGWDYVLRWFWSRAQR